MNRELTSRPLLTYSDLAALHALVLQRWVRQTSKTTFMTGQTPSLYRGWGMELHDTRPYHSGDELRYMDWRATARSGAPIMKVFREERQRRVFLFIDRSPTMAFGTRRTLKATVAAQAAAMITFAALAEHETVAGLVLDQSLASFPPSRCLDPCLKLLHHIAAPLAPNSSPANSDLNNTLHTLDQLAPKGSTIYLISDFHTITKAQEKQLAQLITQRKVIALHVSDPGETTLTNAGKLRMVSPQNGNVYVIDTADAQLREQYANAMAQKQRALTRIFNTANIPLHRLSTHLDIFNQMECVA